MLIGDYNKRQMKEIAYDCIRLHNYPIQTVDVANWLYEKTGVVYTSHQVAGVLNKLQNEGRIKIIRKYPPNCKKAFVYWVLK